MGYQVITVPSFSSSALHHTKIIVKNYVFSFFQNSIHMYKHLGKADIMQPIYLWLWYYLLWKTSPSTPFGIFRFSPKAQGSGCPSGCVVIDRLQRKLWKSCSALYSTAMVLIFTFKRQDTQDSLSLPLFLAFLQSQYCFSVKIYQETGLSFKSGVLLMSEPTAVLHFTDGGKKWNRLTKGLRQVHRLPSRGPLCVDFIFSFHLHNFLLFLPLSFHWTKTKQSL